LDTIRGAGFENTGELTHFASDFSARPEVLSNIFQQDFAFPPLVSHKLRVALIALLQQQRQRQQKQQLVQTAASSSQSDVVIAEASTPLATAEHTTTTTTTKRPRFKSFVVSKQATLESRNGIKKEYGLTPETMPSTLAAELVQFLVHMTELVPDAQEAPIRMSTASVYVRHAKQFFGYYLSHYLPRLQQQEAQSSSFSAKSLSIEDIFPNKEKTSAAPVFEFIKFLRERKTSSSYEANLLRGLTKLVKFRFRKESSSDPTYNGQKSFDDIPIVREMRKLHTDVNRKQKLSPRVSDENKKWLDWTEYLSVVQLYKQDLQEELDAFEAAAEEGGGGKTSSPSIYSSRQRRIADKYQKYLLLAFFATIPDRQRTMRELYIGKTFLRVEEDQTAGGAGLQHRYVIKHAPDDYKTGKNYGDRPPLVVSNELTSSIGTQLQ